MAALALHFLKSKNIDIWIGSYLKQVFGPREKSSGLTHVMFLYVDHFEPRWKTTDIEVERLRVDRWKNEYPKLCENHKDSDGRFPQHTFFYPEEEYREEHLNKVGEICGQGYGEVEVHLHHDDDTSENLRKTLLGFKETLHHKHGFLPTFPESGEIAYAFVHGNWCLDNSRKDGKFCGVNDELIVLRETGCYADFTLPSAPDDSQTKTINKIYYAEDDPVRPKSHNEGVEVEVGVEASGDLMIVQGPLGFNWGKRKFGLLPGLEYGDQKVNLPPTRERIQNWVNSNIHVKGRPEWVFVKIHTHGTQEHDIDMVLGKETDEMFSILETEYNDGEKYLLHYVTSREAYNIIKAAEEGKKGNPNEYRDYILKPPVTYRR